MAPMFTLKGRITEDGKLDVELPPGVPAGEVDVDVRPHVIAKDAGTDVNEDMLWTPAELAELDNIKKIQPAKSGKEVIEMLQRMDLSSWADIDDPVEYIRRQREDEAKRRGLEW